MLGGLDDDFEEQPLRGMVIRRCRIETYPRRKFKISMYIDTSISFNEKFDGEMTRFEIIKIKRLMKIYRIKFYELYKGGEFLKKKIEVKKC